MDKLWGVEPKGEVGDPGCTCKEKPYPWATAYEGNPAGHYIDCPLWGVKETDEGTSD